MESEMMKATLKLVNEKATATGFLLTQAAPNDPAKKQIILVTANHVFETMNGNEAVLQYRQFESEGVYKKMPVKIPIRKEGKALWVKHPTMDVAVVAVVPPKEADVPNISVDILATDEQIKKFDIHPGDDVMHLGYPHRVEANEAGFPILRKGAIASYPLTPTKHNKTFLINSNIFTGDSGGPAYMASENRTVGGKKIAEIRLIMGVVVGHHFVDEEAKMTYSSTRIRQLLGLAIVVPAPFIRETIDLLPKTP